MGLDSKRRLKAHKLRAKVLTGTNLKQFHNTQGNQRATASSEIRATISSAFLLSTPVLDIIHNNNL